MKRLLSKLPIWAELALFGALAVCLAAPPCLLYVRTSSAVIDAASGAGRAEHAGRAMQQIVGSIDQVSQIVGGISNATAQQATGVEQVNQTVAQLDQVTQHNAALVEQAAAATESIKEQAASLAVVVGKFRIGERIASDRGLGILNVHGAAPQCARAVPRRTRAAPRCIRAAHMHGTARRKSERLIQG